jgi:hypothetical protein
VSRYGLVGGTTGELLTFGGRALVHNNKHELEYLFPNTRVVRLSDGDLGQPWMWLKDHPGMGQVRFPLRREDFVRAET